MRCNTVEVPQNFRYILKYQLLNLLYHLCNINRMDVMRERTFSMKIK